MMKKFHLFLFNVLIFSSLQAQKINYRQGELIVWLKKSVDCQSVIKSLSLATENSVQAKELHKDWNLQHFFFDFNRFNTESLLQQLRSNPNVMFAQKNHLLSQRKTPNDTYFNKQWQHLNDGTEGGIAGADFRTSKAWDLTTGGVTEAGDTIVVCIIDGGIELTHADLKKNFWINKFEIPENKIDDDTNGYVDDYKGWNADSGNDIFNLNNHGTAVAGIVGAMADNRLGVCGINWSVKMMMIQGGGDEASAVKSYSYAWKQRKDYNESEGKKGAYVVSTNSSWGRDRGRPEESPIWCAMYDSLGSVGILNIGSTTNSDLDVDLEGDLPTNCESDFLIGVTNLNWNDQKERRAGYGLKSIDIGAYGESIFTTGTPNTFGLFNGTSAAAPQIAGAIGLIYSLPCNGLVSLSKSNPAEAALLARKLLLQNTRKLNSLKNYVSTSGVMNIFDILNAITPIHATVEKTKVSFEEKSITLFPMTIEFRESGTIQWTEYPFVTGQKLTIDQLKKCTEYEFRIKGGCSRYQTEYSNLHKIITEGCCESPTKIEIIESGFDNIILKWKDINQNSNFYYYLNEVGSSRIDSFEILKHSEELLTISGLKRCSRYELRIINFCDDRLSDPSKPMVIQTSGCEQCDDIDYCQRDRPTGDFEWLESIKLNGSHFYSGQNNGFGNYVGVDAFAPLMKSESHTIELVPGYSLDSSLMYFAVWIDFNHNSRMEDSENIVPDAYTNNSISKFTFSIPATSRLGLTRMRAIVKFGENGVPPPTSCFTGIEFGEYEDYCINIVDKNCVAPINITETKKTVQSVNITYTKNDVNDIIQYIYRKLPYGLWTEGTSFGSTIALSKLDSCSQYEIRMSNRCANHNSSELSFLFNTITPECLIGINEISKHRIKIYPNPAYDRITIHSENLITSLKVYNLQGESIYSKDVDKTSIELNLNWTSGIYFIECQMKDGNRITKKIAIR